MSSPLLDVTPDTFSTEVLQSEKTVLVDFWAPWCGVCKTARPMVDTFVERYNDAVKGVAVNAQDFPDLANKYGVMALPTFLVFKNGQVAAQHVGSLSESALSRLVGVTS